MIVNTNQHINTQETLSLIPSYTEVIKLSKNEIKTSTSTSESLRQHSSSNRNSFLFVQQENKIVYQETALIQHQSIFQNINLLQVDKKFNQNTTDKQKVSFNNNITQKELTQKYDKNDQPQVSPYQDATIEQKQYLMYEYPFQHGFSMDRSRIIFGDRLLDQLCHCSFEIFKQKIIKMRSQHRNILQYDNIKPKRQSKRKINCISNKAK